MDSKFKLVSPIGLPDICGHKIPLRDYPDNIHTRDAEQKVSGSLPKISGIDSKNLTDQERVIILKKQVASEYASFIAFHGDPFGEFWVPVQDEKIVEIKRTAQA